MYHNFANLFSKLSESTFYKEISKLKEKLQIKKYWISRFARDSLTLLRTPVSAIFVFAPKINNAAIIMLHCIFG